MSEASAWIRDVAEVDFQRDVIDESHRRPVVVDFWAPWCGPCRALGPLLEAAIQERKGEVLLAKVNVDEAPGLAMEFGVQAIPHVIALQNGKVVQQFRGMVPKAELQAFLDRLRPSEADQLAAQAARLEASQPAEAEKAYRRALEGERDNAAALMGLARLLLGRGQDAEASQLLDRVIARGDQAAEVERLRSLLALRALTKELPSEAEVRGRLQQEPDNPEGRYQLGCWKALQGKYQEALDDLLAAGHADQNLARTKVKETMVKIFNIVGIRSPLADDYRDQLAKLLY